MLCLCETWLRPGELSVIPYILLTHPITAWHEFDCFSKSSIEDDPEVFAGRPYGGLAVLVRRLPGVSVREISCESDRLLVLGFYDSCDRLMHVICNVYLPYYDACNLTQTETFVDTLSLLQAIIDKHSSVCPMKILGDFNVQLPKHDPSNKLWYRQRGYTKHSLILHEFMIENNLVAVDCLVPQKINYTFFCHNRGVHSWIDHILCFRHDYDSILDCAISPLSPDNDSDHLPVHVQFSFSHPAPGPMPPCPSNHQVSVSPPINWSSEAQVRYRNALHQKLSSLEPMQTGNWDSREEAQMGIDFYMSRLCQVITESAVEPSNRRGRKQFQPKPYWCPRLSELREKKRFWWRLWNECDRPRTGAVFDAYKESKKQFRKVSRQRADEFSRGKLNKFNELFYAGKLNCFWRYVRRKRRYVVTSNLQADAFAEFYEGVMTDGAALNQDQKRIADQVDAWQREYSRMQPSDAHTQISPFQIAIKAH